MDGTYGFVSILPVLFLVVVTLLTKRTFESLFFATILALVIGCKGDWFAAFVTLLKTVTSENIWVLLVVGLLGGLVGIFEHSSAALGFRRMLSRFATSRKKSLLAEWVLSILLFVDDYLNILTTGSITKHLNDTHRIHRTMTAYLIGSTSAPIVVLIPLSSWSIYYASLLETSGIVPSGTSAVGMYMQAIPFMFYPIFCLVVLLLVIAGVIPLVGPIKKYQKQADEGGSLYPPGHTEEDCSALCQGRDSTGSVLDFLLPLGLLLAATICLDLDVLNGILIALVFTGIFYFLRKRMLLSAYVDALWEGFSSMVSVLALLVIAFMFKSACGYLGMSSYIIGKVAPLMSGNMLPVVIFLVSTLMTFALANAWSVSAIMVPLVVPLALAINANMSVAIAAIFSGSVFGTQLCFYSDNAILISKATGVPPMEHVKTQLPFALCTGVLTCAAYLIYGLVLL